MLVQRMRNTFAHELLFGTFGEGLAVKFLQLLNWTSGVPDQVSHKCGFHYQDTLTESLATPTSHTAIRLARRFQV